jgi:hypothetical protein
MTEREIYFGTHELVRARWTWIRERSKDFPHLLDLVEAVDEFPDVGALYPFLSVGRLCLSRCTEFPYYVDFLIVFLGRRYCAEATLDRGDWVQTRPLGNGSAREALAIVASHIPAGYGPARRGDASVIP